MLCLNLCDILSPAAVQTDFFSQLPNTEVGTCERIYVGSYFCSQYFLKRNMWDCIIPVANKLQLPVTIVVPVVSERDISEAKTLIQKLLNDYPAIIDEITVNDYGMYRFLLSHYTIKINIGRLFFKDPRDFRIPEHTRQDVLPAFFTCQVFSPLSDRLGCYEIDLTNNTVVIPDGISVGVHQPLCCVTSGFICKYASIHKSIQMKFRPNCRCSAECSHITEHYYTGLCTSKDGMYRIGRAVYSYSAPTPKTSLPPTRNIFLPYFELLGYLMGADPSEDSCTT